MNEAVPTRRRAGACAPDKAPTSDYFVFEDGIEFAGTHLLIDLWGATNLGEIAPIDAALRAAAAACGASLLNIHLHHFGDGAGVTGVAIIAESHISIHTWPERGYAAVDVFMCGACDPAGAVSVLKAAFQPTTVRVTEERRGLATPEPCAPEPEWYDETLDPDLRQRLRISKVLHHEKTAHHDLMVFENPSLGRVLALDGAIQTTEGDEYVYHEMLTHTPILGHGRAKRVLIIGGGDGGVLREVLRHEGVERAVLVDIDETVIALSREHLPTLSNGAFDDPRAEIVIADGARFVHQTGERFDIVIVDSTDPIGPGEALFAESFYAGCKRCLMPGGILVTQNGVPAVQGFEVTQSHQRLSTHFADVAFYLAPVPTYHGGFMAFGWASDNAGVRATTLETIEARYKAAAIATRYYNPEIHQAAFALPNDVRALMG